MKIEDLTIGQAKQLASMFGSKDLQTSQSCSLEIGKCYLIRSVTMYYTGRVVEITDFDVVLEDAAWIASTGRFHEAIKTGSLDEVEPFIDPVAVSKGSIVDFTLWSHALPRVQK